MTISTQRQNKWLRDYVYPIVCDLDLKKAYANYRKNKGMNLPGGHTDFLKFIDYIFVESSALQNLPQETMEFRICKLWQDFKPRTTRDKNSFEYKFFFEMAMETLLQGYAALVEPSKRLPILQKGVQFFEKRAWNRHFKFY